MARAGDKVIRSVGAAEVLAWAEVWGECADLEANRAILTKMDFNSPEEVFFIVLY